jgi:hypothetical protein
MLLRAHAGIDLAARGGQQIHLHAALGKAGLHRLGDGDKRRFVLHVQVKCASLMPALARIALAFAGQI